MRSFTRASPCFLPNVFTHSLCSLAPLDRCVCVPLLTLLTRPTRSGGEEITFLDVAAHSCTNECFTSAFTTNLAILGGGLILAPGRFKAANDGGHNHHSARIGAWVEGGRWEGAGDDTIHVSGLVFSAVQQWNGTSDGKPRLRLHFLRGEPHAAKSIQPGDVLQFLNRTTGLLFSERRVLSVTIDPPVDASVTGGGGLGGTGGVAVNAPTVVTLDGYPGQLDLGVIGANVESATNIYNLNVTATQFVFRGNHVRAGRRFGVLAKGQRMCVESNTFVGLGGAAVAFDYMDTEGLSARSAVVRDNIVRDVELLATHDVRAAFWVDGPYRPSGSHQV